MSTVQKIGFGFQDDQDESLKSKSGGRFGLNQGALLTKFELNENAGAGGAAGNAIDITVKVGEKEFRQRVFEVTKVFDKDNKEIVDSESLEFVNGWNEAMKHLKATMTHYMKAFRTEEELKQAFSVGQPDFKSYANLVASLVKDGIDSKKPLDVFLQYQWNISEGQDRTYLELPKHMKDGAFITPSIAPVGGEWKEVTDGGELSYVDNVGNKHRFHKSKNFMESNKAIRQGEGTSGGAVVNNTPMAQEAKKSSW